MKGLILSGGKGTRLRPLTHTSAKQLIPVANKPILFYGLEAMREAEITRVGIIVADTKEEIISHVGDGSAWGLEVTYIDQSEPLGLAHAVLTAEDYLKDDDLFVMYLGDNIIKEGFKSLVDEFLQNRPNAQILLAHVHDPERFGVAELSNGRVVRLIEKPQVPPSGLALVGVYMFDHNIFTAAKSIKPSARGELEITDAIQFLIDEGYVVDPHVINGWWKDTGKLEDLLEANRILLDDLETRIDGSVDERSRIIGKVIVEKEATVVNSTIRGPAIIGEGSIIENAYVGPFTSVYYNSLISHSEIEHSMVLENVKLCNIPVRIEDSLLGKNVEIIKSDAKPKAYRFMLGDNSMVGLV
ncbi:glucose-1-phosphate thymidylyltransferase [Candidatus Hakubella thermalkaliphila]|uniref:Glucose-1-phosphate thymidylyltransferase n=1 Tax=Candidatus Hakubella thermalkaliphila TaxID=2754717 RepID=A0A6V8P4A0_9ACTN|nr:glucose-1-phosphate thymidylyltransferase [Candidatus Hakubella thermalkaliphila]GFP27187.1 glucose-1-phosphate thymidylyltransferase [Candidatus Hakubella thermalkaliphila]